jgi:hypothetical protein
VAINYLPMWRPGREEPEGIGAPLDHAAGDHYRAVAAGGAVWFVSVRAGRLELYGRLVVGEVTDHAGAARALGATDLVPAEYHLVAAPGTVRLMALHRIHPIARQIRFTDLKGIDRLVISPDDTVNAHQLLPLRVLAPESVERFAEVCGARA